jgi:hypothetical protein
MKIDDKILLTNLKKLLLKKFELNILNVIGYGSRVHKNKSDADLDIIIVTNEKLSWVIQRVIKMYIYNYGIDNDVVFDPKFYTNNEIKSSLSNLPLIKEVNRTGITL